jgi:hypothetical protein
MAIAFNTRFRHHVDVRVYATILGVGIADL